MRKIFDDVTADGDITADSFIRDGGTSSQYLMADGSTTTSSGGSSPWTTDTNGITYTAGNVGIGTSSHSSADLQIGSNGMLCDGNAKVSGQLEINTLKAGGGTGSIGQVLTIGFTGPAWATMTSPGGISIGSTASNVFSMSGSTFNADDPGADNLVYWNDASGELDHLGIGANLSISNGELVAVGGGGGTTQNLFSSIAIAGQTTVTANSATTTLNFAAGSGISFATNNSTKTITITSTGGGGGGGDITAVTAGNGLSGGGTAGDVTLAADLGVGLAFSSGKIVPDGTVARTSVSNSFSSATFQRINGELRDAGNSSGNAGQTLQSTGTNIDWVNAGKWQNSSNTNYLNQVGAKISVGGTNAEGWLHIRKSTASTSTPTVIFEATTSDTNSDNFVTFKASNRFWSHGVDASANDWKVGYTTSGAAPFTTTGNVKLRLTSGGNLYAANFILTSDKRLKENIKDVDYSEHIKADWKTFTLKKNEEEKRYGVIAQELEEHHPEFVNTDDKGYKSVKYIDLLVAKIAELEARLEKLEK